MKRILIMAGLVAGISALSAASAAPDAQYGANIIKEKAIHFATEAAKDPHFDMQAASRVLSQDAMALGKVYGHGFAMLDVTSAQCLEEVALLGLQAQTFLNKALAGEYKTIVMVNGNLVMLAAAGAGSITYLAIDRGGYCHQEASIHDSYWAANIIRLGMDGVNLAFS